MSRFIVAGGGIGGLATALSVAAAGHEVVVLEARDEFTELGAGIQLAPNAFRALDRLGAGPDVRDRAVFIDELRLMNGVTGRPITAMGLGADYRRRFGNPYAVVHRTDLYAPLLSRARAEPGIELRTGTAVRGYDHHPGGVTVKLATGRTVAADALIGADGIRSAIRQGVVGDGAPRVSGHTIYRSVIPIEDVPPELRFDAVTLWAGPAWHFVHYPISGGRSLNLAATRDDGATTAVSGEPVAREHVLGQFPGAGVTAAALLELGNSWRRWVLCDRDPVPTWHDGPVVLLGDAAHPMLQYAAQGACQALEDAVALGDLLRGPAAPVADVFARFTAERRDRTRAAQLLARRIGRQIYHASGRMAAARDARLSTMDSPRLWDSVAWLHGGVEPEALGAD
jgi:2-polyprenyl-6-methoxyphenol hydroxylase-like FAD-dependent oxidoreductase